MNSDVAPPAGGDAEERAARLPISLCMIVRDESRFLAECLRSAAPYVAEMIVVDTGSTDDTVEIALAWGAEAIRLTWRDDFAAARNVSLAAASQPWILVLDADERLAAGDLHTWAAMFGEHSKQGYFVKINSWVGSGPLAATVTDAACRIFRADERVQFRGAVHEEAATAILEAFGDGAIGYVPDGGPEIWHEGYRDEIVEERDKFARNRGLLERALAADPDNPDLRYATGAELFAAGRFDAALAWLEPLAALALSEREPGYGSDILLKIVHACRSVGRLEDAARYAMLGTERYADFADLHEARSEVMLALDEPLVALRSAVAALRQDLPPFVIPRRRVQGRTDRYVWQGASLERLYRFREAAEAYAEAIAEHPLNRESWQRLLLLGQLDADIRPLWLQAAEALRLASEREGKGTEAGARHGEHGEHGEHLSGFFAELLDWLSDMRLPEEAEAIYSIAAGKWGIGGAELLHRGLWLVQRGESEAGERVWQAVREHGTTDVEQSGVYEFAVALRDGDFEHARVVVGRWLTGCTAEAALRAIAVCEDGEGLGASSVGGERGVVAGVGVQAPNVGREAKADALLFTAADGAIGRALLRLGAFDAWLRLQAANARAAPARPPLGAAPPPQLAPPPPPQLAALLRAAPAAQLPALRALLAAAGAGQPPAAAARQRLAAGWAAAAGGAWRTAAEDFAAVALAEGARPWQRRAAAAGLAAAHAALARAAAAAAGNPCAGEHLPALYSEQAVPLILGTAILPPR